MAHAVEGTVGDTDIDIQGRMRESENHASSIPSHSLQ